jgi:hypothetical protein
MQHNGCNALPCIVYITAASDLVTVHRKAHGVDRFDVSF